MKILPLILALISLNFAVSTDYNPVGTGEAGAVAEKLPEKINYLQTMRSNVDPPPGIDLLDPRFFVLDGALTDNELEDEINAFIMDSVKAYGEYSGTGVYITALNGYIEVAVDYAHMDGGDYGPYGIIAIWNMKTGERLRHFSDMFYEGVRFLPAVISAERKYNKDNSLTITKEPEKFSMTALLSGSYHFTENFLDGIPTYDLPLYTMNDAYLYMPMWQYFDMSDMFTGKTQISGGTLVPVDFSPEKFTVKSERDGKLSANYIYSSLYMSNAEIYSRNRELKLIYEEIKTSAEYKRFPNGKYDEIYTTVDFDGDITTVTTGGIGTFARNRKTGEMFTPKNCKILEENQNFRALIDTDLDGTAEIISVYDDRELRIYDSNLRIKKILPFINVKRVYLPLLWSVKKTPEGFIGEIFVTSYDGKTYSLKYENNKYGEFTAAASEANFFFENDFELGVVYSGNALEYSVAEFLNGTAESHFEAISEAAYSGDKNITAAERSARGIELAVWKENELLINGKDTDYETFDDLPSYCMGVHTIGESNTYGSVAIPEKRKLRSVFTLIDYEEPVNSTLNPLFEITDNGFVEVPVISRMNYFLTAENGDISAMFKGGGFVRYKDDPDPIDTNTDLRYWFREGTKSYYGYDKPFAEYGGIDFPVEIFRETKNGAAILDGIEKDGGTVINILYRDNGIININYKKPVEEGSDWYEYRYKTYRDLYEAYGYSDYAGTLFRFVEEGGGTYLPSVSAEIDEDLAKVVYPNYLPYGRYWWLE